MGGDLKVRMKAIKPPPKNCRYDIVDGIQKMSAKTCVEGDSFTVVVMKSCSEGDQVYAKYHDAFFLASVSHINEDEGFAAVAWEEDGDSGCPNRVQLEHLYLADEVMRYEHSNAAVSVG